MEKRKWYIEQLTAPALMHRNATKFGDNICQMFKGEDGEVKQLTYSQVYRIVKELSSGLIDMGFKKGDRAAIMCNTAPQWM
ncbi:MAG TPA: AMP-binding protein, partial [Spirochaetota bacterium]|nr:AMP-binding protein [Spirochaetota bacterium]